MALITLKPTSPGRRSMVRVFTPGLHKGDPYAPLTESQGKTGGRNHYGRITVRHKGGGAKQNYRVIDFKRDKEGIACRVERIEYDPNRTAHIALVLYTDGERRYIIATKGMATGDEVRSGSDSPTKAFFENHISSLPEMWWICMCSACCPESMLSRRLLAEVRLWKCSQTFCRSPHPQPRPTA